MTNYFLLLAFTLFIYMNAWFLLSLIRKRNDLADVAWGIGFVLLAWTSIFLSQDFEIRSLIVNLLVTIWGLRLAWHIYKRNKGKPEDYRYLAWRQQWGKWFYIRSYLQIYLLQGLFLFIISLPILAINIQGSSEIGLFDFLGITVWLIGFFFEVVGDWQLKQFIKEPTNKGKLITTGLWQYSRHPNYFGEVTQWWGIWLIALVTPLGWISLLGPLTISFLILKVSGIPMLEKKMSQNPAFAEYEKRVSKFFPLPPKK